MDTYQLPQRVTLEEIDYDLNTDFRQILKIFRVFDDESLPLIVRWLVALRLFYRQEVARPHRQAAMEYLGQFLRCGAPDTPGQPLYRWDTDGPAIIAGVNAAAGQEIRALPYVHWWTFLGWFHAIGQGQLATVVGLRQKLRAGRKLEDWEQDFYRQNRALVVMSSPLTAAEATEKARLNRLLGK